MAVDFNAGDTVRDLERSITRDTRRGLLAGLAVLVNASPVGAPESWDNPAAADSAVRRGYVGGHFRRNWQVGVGIDPTAEIEGGQGSGQAEVIAAGGVVIKRARFDRLAFIVNNVPYANRLADGHSGQAPAGWIDAGVNAIVRAFDRSEEL